MCLKMLNSHKSEVSSGLLIFRCMCRALSNLGQSWSWHVQYWQVSNINLIILCVFLKDLKSLRVKFQCGLFHNLVRMQCRFCHEMVLEDQWSIKYIECKKQTYNMFFFSFIVQNCVLYCRSLFYLQLNVRQNYKTVIKYFCKEKRKISIYLHKIYDFTPLLQEIKMSNSFCILRVYFGTLTNIST